MKNRYSVIALPTTGSDEKEEFEAKYDVSAKISFKMMVNEI